MNDEEFLKLVFEKGKVEDVSKAFEEFPPEEEWHEGKIENILNESSGYYGDYSIGDIVFVEKYKYINGKNGYNHLFVIISKRNIAVPIESFGILISSNLDKLKYPANVFLKKDKKNGLSKNSIVKTDRIYMIENDQILFKIGKVDLDKVEKYKKLYFEKLK